MYTPTKSDLFILGAIEKGYFADESGRMYSPDGKEIGQNQAKKSGHLSVTLYVTGINKRNFQSVLVHRFCAAYFFGPSALKAQCVRHLNDIPNDNRKRNLCPGTKSDNRRDICPKRLSEIAKVHSAPGLVARSRKLTDEDVQDMRVHRESNGDSYAKIAEKFNVTAMTAYRAINKQSWKGVS